MNRTYKFGPHKVEIRYHHTGSYSPWHGEVYEKEGLGPCLVSADVAYFMRVDGKDIYQVLSSDVYDELAEIEKNYDYYPAEMVEKFKQLLSSPKLDKRLTVEESLKRIREREKK